MSPGDRRAVQTEHDAFPHAQCAHAGGYAARRFRAPTPGLRARRVANAGIHRDDRRIPFGPTARRGSCRARIAQSSRLERARPCRPAVPRARSSSTTVPSGTATAPTLRISRGASIQGAYIRRRCRSSTSRHACFPRRSAASRPLARLPRALSALARRRATNVVCSSDVFARSGSMPPYTYQMLRAVNVGGTSRIKMDALRAVYESIGLSDVRTLLQSGNVVVSQRPQGSRAAREAHHAGARAATRASCRGHRAHARRAREHRRARSRALAARRPEQAARDVSRECARCRCASSARQVAQ